MASTERIFVALGAVIACGAVANCRSLIGIEDLQGGAGDASVQTGGSGGSGGSTGGKGGTGASGGSGGVDGGGGTSASGGTGAIGGGGVGGVGGMGGVGATGGLAGGGGVAGTTGGGGTGGVAGSSAGGTGGCGDTLTDPSNCGACNHDCLGGNCITGFCQPVTLATSPHPIGVVVTNSKLYWSDDTNGTITVSATDGTSAQAYAANQDSIAYLASDGTDLYWNALGAAHRRSLGGGPIFDLVTATNLQGIAFTTTELYFNESDLGLFSAPKAGGAATPVDTPVGVVFAEGVAEWNGIVYWCDNGGTIHAYDPSTSSSNPFITGEGSPAGITIYNAVVYWTNQSPGELRSRPVAGGIAQTIVSGLSVPTGVALDTKAVYWAEAGAGIVRRLAL